MSAAVDRFMATLDHPRKEEIAQVRAIILAADPGITERIKWKAPSFCFGGDDRVTLRLQPQNRLQLIFHRGVKVKDSTNFVFDDPTGLLQWITPDRASITLHTRQEITDHEVALKAVVAKWMAATVD